MASYWLLKSEPEVYSYADLVRDQRTNWDHVRNFQARNFLKAIKKGDTTLIYHSGDEKSVVGIAECVKEGYADIDEDDGKEWVQIDIGPKRALAHPVPLATIKATPALKDISLIRQSRLSVMPITKTHFEALMKLSEKATAETPGKKNPKKKAKK